MAVSVLPKGFVGLLLCSFASGCMVAPVATAPRTAPPPPAQITPMPGDLSPSTAEQACISAGQERGLDVSGIAGSREVTDAGGQPARDVMLRVNRAGAQLEIRCNYDPASGVARIMLI